MTNISDAGTTPSLTAAQARTYADAARGGKSHHAFTKALAHVEDRAKQGLHSATVGFDMEQYHVASIVEDRFKDLGFSVVLNANRFHKSDECPENAYLMIISW